MFKQGKREMSANKTSEVGRGIQHTEATPCYRLAGTRSRGPLLFCPLPFTWSGRLALTLLAYATSFALCALDIETPRWRTADRRVIVRSSLEMQLQNKMNKHGWAAGKLPRSVVVTEAYPVVHRALAPG